jgi:hypothetical protein
VTRTDYYIVAVSDDGDVLAAPAILSARIGLDISCRIVGGRETFAFENQGEDPESIWDAARDALAAVIPNTELEDE